MASIIQKTKTFLKSPKVILRKFANSKCFTLLPDNVALKFYYKLTFNKKLNLKNPKTFNEKLQWLKLYNRDPQLTTLVDKYEVKNHIKNILGEEYIIPTLGVYDKFEDIEFDKLPNQFVLKCNHGSGDVVICKNKDTFDKELAKKKLTKSLKTNYYKISREWPYKNVKRKIICEQFLSELSGDISDYKFFCFNGEPKIMFVATDRSTDCRFDFFDMEFNHLDIVNIHPQSDKKIEKPEKFEEMIEIAKKLSKDMIHVRIDLYEINGKIYFGEYTFFHAGGFSQFYPYEHDYILGEYIKLPIDKKEE